MRGYVVDASVVVKWYFADEVDADRASNLLHHALAGSVELHGTRLLPFEVASAITAGVIRKARAAHVPVAPEHIENLTLLLRDLPIH